MKFFSDVRMKSGMSQGRLRYTQQCNLCNYKFASEHDLLVHKLTHSDKHFSCDRCLAVFSKEPQFERHRTLCQGGKKPHVCNDCGDVFKTGQQLDEHQRRVHQNSKIYECSSCNAKFAWHDNLLRHERMHKAESCICKVCGAIFGSSASVKVHLWKAHNQVLQEDAPQAKPFMCNFCKKSFRFAKNLKIHVCVSGSRPSSLSSKTSAEKPYHCDICDKSFKYDFSYDAHMRVHGEPSEVFRRPEKGTSAVDRAMLIDNDDPERPHKCGVCGIGFKYDFSLMAHMKTHTDLETNHAMNGGAEKSGSITMAQFAEMIHSGLDPDTGHGGICVEPVDDHDSSALSVEMYDFPEQEVTMLPVSQLPSGLLNLLFQQPDPASSETATSSSSCGVAPDKPQPVAASSGIMPFQDASLAASTVQSGSPDSSSLPPSLNLGDVTDASKHQVEQDKDQIYTIHSVILNGMRLTTNTDDSCLEEL